MAAKRIQVTTNLRCEGCVGTIKPHFDAAPGVDAWSVDLTSPRKTLTVEGDAAEFAVVDGLLQKAGYRAVETVNGQSQLPAPSTTASPTYFPLLLIAAYLVLSVAVAEVAADGFSMHRGMTHFMAGFFIVFSFFKMLDLPGFARSFAEYDLLAQRWPGFGFVYPFVELTLGLAYLAGVWPQAVNWTTLVVMVLGSAGVVKSLASGRKIRCDCLGTAFNLPMSTVTLVEDGLMAVMAAVMLVR